MDDLTPEDYSQKVRCHAIMKSLKDQDKRPHFMGGRLRTTDGFVQLKTVRDFNKKNKVPDKRREDITTDMLTMYMNPKKAQELADKDKDKDQEQEEENQGDEEEEEEEDEDEDEDVTDKTQDETS